MPTEINESTVLVKHFPKFTKQNQQFSTWQYRVKIFIPERVGEWLLGNISVEYL